MGMMDVSRRRRRMGSAVTPDYAAPAQFSPSEFKKRLSAAFLIIPNSKFDRTLTRRRAWWAT